MDYGIGRSSSSSSSERTAAAAELLMLLLDMFVVHMLRQHAAAARSMLPFAAHMLLEHVELSCCFVALARSHTQAHTAHENEQRSYTLALSLILVASHSHRNVCNMCEAVGQPAGRVRVLNKYEEAALRRIAQMQLINFTFYAN